MCSTIAHAIVHPVNEGSVFRAIEYFQFVILIDIYTGIPQFSPISSTGERVGMLLFKSSSKLRLKKT